MTAQIGFRIAVAFIATVSLLFYCGRTGDVWDTLKWGERVARIGIGLMIFGFVWSSIVNALSGQAINVKSWYFAAALLITCFGYVALGVSNRHDRLR